MYDTNNSMWCNCNLRCWIWLHNEETVLVFGAIQNICTKNLQSKDHCYENIIHRWKITINQIIVKRFMGWCQAKRVQICLRPHNKASTNGPLSDICNVMSFHIIRGLLQLHVTEPDRDRGSGSKLLWNLHHCILQIEPDVNGTYSRRAIMRVLSTDL